MAKRLSALFSATASALILTSLPVGPAAAQAGFPFSSEMTLDVAPLRGSKRIPNIEIGQSGDVVLELWCKGARGQFAVANDTIIFSVASVDNRNCPADRAAADDALLASMAEVTTWRREGQSLVLTGAPKQLRFRLNTN